jgi:hypothetical protein
MCFVDDGVRPEVGCAIVESRKNAGLCIWETPVWLLAWIWRRVWCGYVDAAYVPQIVSDVRSGVLIAC